MHNIVSSKNADAEMRQIMGNQNKEMIQKAKSTHKYDDIIDLDYPLKQHDIVRHPPMSIADRAKIFSPFAALKGHGEAIQEREMEELGEWETEK